MTVEAETTERISAATPALELADLLDAVSAHLRKHPHLPPVNVDRFSNSLHISGMDSGGWTDEGALHAWAKSVEPETITAYRYTEANPGSDREIKVVARCHLYSIEVEVWSALAAVEWFGLDYGQDREVSLSDLEILASASTEAVTTWTHP